MLQREWREVQAITYTDDLDSYGQRYNYTTKNIKMVCHTAQDSNVLNPKYVDITMVGITDDISIADADVIIIDNVRYIIKYMVQGKKYLQVMMSNE